ncbi:hypothetical protein GCM10009552_31600 [Rothia nasimurium]
MQGVLVAIGGGHVEQFFRIVEAGAHLFDAGDDGIELGTFTAQVLGALGIVPDAGAFQLAVDFF